MHQKQVHAPDLSKDAYDADCILGLIRSYGLVYLPEGAGCAAGYAAGYGVDA
jgi:hypothetical protein